MSGFAMSGWGIFAGLLAITLVFYVRRARVIYQARERAGTPPILKLVISGWLIVLSSVGFAFDSVPWWVHVLRVVALQGGLLLSYSGNMWLLTGQTHILHSSQLFITTMILLLFITLSGYMSRNNINPIFTSHVFQHSAVYYIHYGIITVSLLLLYGYIIRVVWKSLQQSQDLMYLIRRYAALITFLAGAACALLFGFNLLVSMTAGDTYRQSINRVFFSLLPLCALMPIVNATPQSVLTRAVRPIIWYVVKRQRQQDELLAYLHDKMLMLAPSVHLRTADGNKSSNSLRMEIEIEDAREIIWSHVPRSGVLPAKYEAQRISDFLHNQQIFTKPGCYIPAPLASQNVRHHNIAVAKYLKRCEAEHCCRKSSQDNRRHGI